MAPNILYYIALFGWPLFAFYIFKKFPIEKATFLLLLLPFLFLPFPVPNAMPIKLPLLPPLDRKSIPILTILIILYFHHVKLRWVPKTILGAYLCFAAIINPFFTVAGNTDDLYYHTTFLPGLKFSESISLSMFVLISFVTPFILGYNLLGSNKAHEEILKLTVIWGLIYSVLILYEVRMSPQLHTKVYGFFPHDDWTQQIRAGGFRPVVFLGHGLMVAIFECLLVVAAFVLWQQKHEFLKGKGFWLVMYFLVLLVLTKSYSGLSYVFLFFGMIFLGKNMRYRLLALMAAVVMFYPAVRSYLPISDIVNFFNDLNPERASSLKFRIDNEDILLAKANERSVFGWGTWGRNRVYDSVSGQDVSVTDGFWILYYGQAGWHGYLAVFGLLCVPLFSLWRLHVSSKAEQITPYTYGVAAMVLIFLVDQIPNASLSYMTFLLAGAVYARVHQVVYSSLPKDHKTSSLGPH